MVELLTLYLAGLVGAVVHETGHVIACLARGRSIRSVSVGSGFGVQVRQLKIGLIPWGGGVRFEAREESTWSRVLLYGSGPLASALLAGTLAIGVWAGAWGVAALLLVALQLVVSLLPTAGSDLSNMRRKEQA